MGPAVAAFAAGFAVAVATTPVGVSGAVFLLPIQVSLLGVPSPAVTPTNLLFNVVAVPAALARHRRAGASCPRASSRPWRRLQDSSPVRHRGRIAAGAGAGRRGTQRCRGRARRPAVDLRDIARGCDDLRTLGGDRPTPHRAVLARGSRVRPGRNGWRRYRRGAAGPRSTASAAQAARSRGGRAGHRVRRCWPGRLTTALRRWR